jgi:hypothetical protein
MLDVMASKIVSETLPELRDTLLELLKAEDGRADSFHARGSALIGFIGIVLSVGTATGVALGKGPALHWGWWSRTVIAGFMVGALLALFLAVVVVVVNVLRPLPGETIGLRDIDDYNEPKFTALEPRQFHRYLIDAYGQGLRSERERNNGKAEWLTWSYILVTVGLACVVIAGVTATLDRYVG